MQTVPELSIVMPVLNEEFGIAAALEALASMRSRGTEVVVVDGGSKDRSVELAGAFADQVLGAPRGRASQMNAGAAAARAKVLVFLHADTRLPEYADRMVVNAIESGHYWGRFDVRIEGKSAWLSVVAALMNWRSRLTGIATGDQAIFVSRVALEAAGGFPEIPLMEDIEVSRRLLRTGRPACLAARVTTSGRRWEAQGVWRTILRMWWLRLRYYFGADPGRLALEYGCARQKS